MIIEQLKTAIEAAPQHNLEWAVHQAPSTGLFLEFGVAEGNTLRRIAGAIPTTVYGFDSFDGLPEQWRHYPLGQFRQLELPRFQEQNIEVVVGLFAETLPTFVATYAEPVAFMHIDCDLYSSTKCVFDHFKHRFQNGSIIAFDEICDYAGWEEHEFRAFAEFLTETGYGWECISHEGERATFKLVI